MGVCGVEKGVSEVNRLAGGRQMACVPAGKNPSGGSCPPPPPLSRHCWFSTPTWKVLRFGGDWEGGTGVPVGLRLDPQLGLPTSTTLALLTTGMGLPGSVIKASGAPRRRKMNKNGLVF